MLDLLRSVDRRLADVQGSLAPLRELSEIRQGISALDTRLDRLDVLGDLPRILGAVEPLAGHLARLDDAIGQFEQQVATMSGAVAPLDGDLKQICGDTGALGRDLAGVLARMGAIDDDGIAPLVARLDRLVDRVREMHCTL